MVPFDIELVPAGTIPAGMVRVLGGTYRVVPLLGLRSVAVALEPFFIDRFEVTNREFREFVESGGYGSEEHWPERAGRGVAIRASSTTPVDPAPRRGSWEPTPRARTTSRSVA